MSLNPPSRTRATVVRAGHRTTPVSLSDWYGGQILAPVDTWTLMVATGRSRSDLRRSQLWVMARVGARSAEFLELQAGRRAGSGTPAGHQAAPASEGECEEWLPLVG